MENSIEIPTDKLLLKTEEAAEVLRISRTKMSELLLAGTVPSIKIGSLRRVPVAALKHYVEREMAEVA